MFSRYKCRTCGLTFKLVGLFTSHMRRCHSSGGGPVTGGESPPAECGWHQLVFTVRGPTIPGHTATTTAQTTVSKTQATARKISLPSTPNSGATTPKPRPSPPVSVTSQEGGRASPAISVKSVDSASAHPGLVRPARPSSQPLTILRLTPSPENKDQCIKQLLATQPTENKTKEGQGKEGSVRRENEALVPRSVGGGGEADGLTFHCVYHAQCSYTAPNQTEAVLRHIVASHTTSLSPVTITAITKSIDLLSGAANPLCHNNNNVRHVTKEESKSTKSCLPVSHNGGLANGSVAAENSDDSDNRHSSGLTRLKRKASSLSMDSSVPSPPGDRTAREGWWQPNNTCVGVVVNIGREEVACRHQGLGKCNRHHGNQIYSQHMRVNRTITILCAPYF